MITFALYFHFYFYRSSPAPPQTPIGPSAPIFLKDLKNSPLKPGSQIILEARVVGNPEPQVEWLKNGSSLNNYRFVSVVL